MVPLTSWGEGHLGNIVCWSWCWSSSSLPSSSLTLDQILLRPENQVVPLPMAGRFTLFLDVRPLLTWHPGVCDSKYSLLEMFPGVPVRRRDLVKPLSEEEAEVLIGVWVVGASFWIPVGNAQKAVH